MTTEYATYAALKLSKAETALARARGRLELAESELAPAEADHIADGDGFVSEYLLRLRHNVNAADRSVVRAEAVLADARARAEAPRLPGLE